MDAAAIDSPGMSTAGFLPFSLSKKCKVTDYVTISFNCCIRVPKETIKAGSELLDCEAWLLALETYWRMAVIFWVNASMSSAVKSSLHLVVKVCSIFVSLAISGLYRTPLR